VFDDDWRVAGDMGVDAAELLATAERGTLPAAARSQIVARSPSQSPGESCRAESGGSVPSFVYMNVSFYC
jgi:hypothetical protein